MEQFRWLYEDAGWINSNAIGECTVIVHGDPYQAKQHITMYQCWSNKGWWLQRQYPMNFYLKDQKAKAAAG